MEEMSRLYIEKTGSCARVVGALDAKRDPSPETKRKRSLTPSSRSFSTVSGARAPALFLRFCTKYFEKTVVTILFHV